MGRVSDTCILTGKSQIDPNFKTVLRALWGFQINPNNFPLLTRICQFSLFSLPWKNPNVLSLFSLHQPLPRSSSLPLIDATATVFFCSGSVPVPSIFLCSSNPFLFLLPLLSVLRSCIFIFIFIFFSFYVPSL